MPSLGAGLRAVSGRIFTHAKPFGYTIPAQTARVRQGMAFWMGVAAAEHARAGRDGGFAQLGHGKHLAVKALKRGDWIVYYAPREGMGQGATVRAFVSLGRVTSDAPYQARQAPGFLPFRVDVDYLHAAQPAPIKPMLEDLDLTRGRGPGWGIVMRVSRRRLSEGDMRTIAAAMGVGAAFEALSG